MQLGEPRKLAVNMRYKTDIPHTSTTIHIRRKYREESVSKYGGNIWKLAEVGGDSWRSMSFLETLRSRWKCIRKLVKDDGSLCGKSWNTTVVGGSAVY